MTIIAYRPAYSLIRFSTPQQALGDSLRRQLEATTAFCLANNLELVESIRDEGLSGYHGAHRKRGALGRFVKRFLTGEIKPGVFIAEAFDRITREPVRKAAELFLTLINNGMDVHLTIINKTFTAASIDANIGELYMAIGMMVGAHGESHAKAARIGETWNAPNGRRNGGFGRETKLPANNFPDWIVKTKDGPQLDKAKHQILHRIRKLLPKMGMQAIARMLNAEGVRRRRGKLWDVTTIQKIVRGRQVLGEQAVGRYMDVKDPTTGETTFKRVLTGEIVKDAYPAAWTEDEWFAANAVIDGRKRGVQSGRNRTAYVNLFGDLARCETCGRRMAVRGKGRVSSFKYLGCGSARVHGCTNKRYHRLDEVERGVFQMIGAITWESDNKQGDETEALADQLANAKRDSDKLQRSLDQMAATFGDSPPAIKTSMLKVAADHTEKRATVTTLERRLAALRTAKPVSLDEVQTITRRLESLSGDALVAARGKVAALLPSVFREFRFGDAISVTLTDGRKYTLGEWRGGGGLLWRVDNPLRWDASAYRDPNPEAISRQAKRALEKFDKRHQPTRGDPNA